MDKPSKESHLRVKADQAGHQPAFPDARGTRRT